MTKSKRCATVKTITYSHLYSLSIENFEKLLDNHILIKKTLLTVAAERLTQFKKNSKLFKSNEEQLCQDKHALKTFFHDVAPNASEESQSETEISKSEVNESEEYVKI